jgi:hypothetical protein
LHRLAVLADNDGTLDRHCTPLLRLAPLRAGWRTDGSRFLIDGLVSVASQRAGRFRGPFGVRFAFGGEEASLPRFRKAPLRREAALRRTSLLPD